MSKQIDVIYTELAALKIRFTVFLDKLKIRAEELSNETKANAQLMMDEDEQSYFNFKNGITGQFTGLERKADEVFEAQIEPFHYRELQEELGIRISSGELDQVNDLYNEINDYFYQWKNEISDLEKNAFEGVKKKKSAKQQLADINAEFEDLKTKFTCTQCGSPIELETIYFMSTYVKCPSCSSQNTFIPSSTMMQLPYVVREIAENKASKYGNYSSEDSLTRFKEDDRYNREVLHISNVMIPILEKENQDIYARNMVDQYNYFDGDDDLEGEAYFNRIMSFYEGEIQSSTTVMKESLGKAQQIDEFAKAYQNWRDDSLGIFKLLEKIKKATNGFESSLFSELQNRNLNKLPLLVDWKNIWQQEGKEAVIDLFNEI